MEPNEQAEAAGKAPEAGARKPEKKKASQSDNLFDLLQSVTAALVGMLLVFVFIARVSVVVGGSMENTLLDGDRLVVSNLFYTPKYGDIVVLRKDDFSESPIIKRVIATEGQTVDIDFDAGVVYVDGKALDEPYTKAPTYEPESFDGEITVPEGCVFVMGDNRNNSTDSRYFMIGCVDTRYIIGKALFRLTPAGRFGGIY